MTVELQAISPDEYGPHSPAPKWKCFLAIMDCVEPEEDPVVSVGMCPGHAVAGLAREGTRRRVQFNPQPGALSIVLADVV